MVARICLTEVQDESAVVEVFLRDGRQFSILTTTPRWFMAAFQELGLDYYFGPPVLFLPKMTLKDAKKAVAAMTKDGEVLLCQYDTPRKTLPAVLEEFKNKQKLL